MLRSIFAGFLTLAMLAAEDGFVDAVPDAALRPTWHEEQVETISATRDEICLNGVWRFMPAIKEAAKAPLATGWGLIRVPGSWMESGWPPVIGAELLPGSGGQLWKADLRSDLTLNHMWYQRPLAIPPGWKGRRIALRCAGLGTDAAVFIDGKPVGSIAFPGGDVDLTAALTPGATAQLMLRVVVSGPSAVAVMMGYGDDGRQVKNDIRSRGLVDDVSLVAIPRLRLEDAVVRTSTRQHMLAVQAALSEPLGTGWTVTARVLDAQGTVLKQFDAPAMATGATALQAAWPWSDPPSWSPDSPTMLTLALGLRAPDGSTVDELREDFGFREFWVDGRDFMLNGVRTRLRPAPNGTPKHAGFHEVIAHHLDAYKAMGVNFIEIWPSDLSDRTCYEYRRQLAAMASRSGMLIAGGAPSMLPYLDRSDGAAAYRAACTNDQAMRQVINQPSVVMWGHSGNVFNSAIQPQNLGRRSVTTGIMFKTDEQIAHDFAAGARLAEALRSVDPSRVLFAHHGMAGGDFHTANMYLNLIPLQEREEWFSDWARNGEVPFMVVEFGEPLAQTTLLRGRNGFHGTVCSEALPSEHLAAYLGADSYRGETVAFRDQLVRQFRGGQQYDGWWEPSAFTHAANAQQMLGLFLRSTWRSWRTWGVSGGMIGWTLRELGWQAVPGADRRMIDLPPFTPGRRGLYATRLPALLARPFDPAVRALTPVGQAFVASNQPTLAWLAGADAGESGYGGGFTDKAHNLAAGVEVRKQVVLINDGARPQRFTYRWAVNLAGREVRHGEAEGTLAAGEIAFKPLAFTMPAVETGKSDGVIELSATIGTTVHADRFLFRVFAPNAPIKTSAVAVFDPPGETTRMLAALGVATVAWTPGTPVPAPLLMVGRRALEQAGGMPAEVQAHVEQGGRCLLMAQDPQWLRDHFKVRVASFLSRRVFPVGSGHPILAGLDAEDLRDWTGSSSLVEAYPDWRSRDAGRWDQWFPYAGWHWGNRGAVTSAAIEVPHHGGWTPILACEFDMAFSPLLERAVGRGWMGVCLLDLEDHVGADPVARQLAARLVEYAAAVKPLAPRQAIVVGSGRWKPLLDEIGLMYSEAPGLPSEPAVVVLGPGSDVTAASLDAFVATGGKVLVLAADRANGPGATTLLHVERCAGSLSVPGWPEARGLGAGDLRRRAEGPAWLLSGGCEIAADGLLGVRRAGSGTAVFCQLDPAALDADVKTYLRFTRWRQTRAISQLLANLGARFATDTWFLEPRADDTIALAGTGWKARLIVRHQAPARFEDRIKESGISDAAKAAVRADLDDSAWQDVKVPRSWELYGGEWVAADGEGVFRRSLDIPAAWKGADIDLGLGELHAFDEVYWNGTLVGRTGSDGSVAITGRLVDGRWNEAPNPDEKRWWLVKRHYIVPAALVRPGRNVLAVRIYNDWNEGGFCGVPEDLVVRRLHPAGGELYHPDYRTDFAYGDDPFRYFNW